MSYSSVSALSNRVLTYVGERAHRQTEDVIELFTDPLESPREEAPELGCLWCPRGSSFRHVKRKLDPDQKGAVSKVVKGLLRFDSTLLQGSGYKCSWRRLNRMVKIPSELKGAIEACWRKLYPMADPQTDRRFKVTMTVEWIAMERIVNKESRARGANSSFHPAVVITDEAVYGGLAMMCLRPQNLTDLSVWEMFKKSHRQLLASGVYQPIGAMSEVGQLMHQSPNKRWSSLYYLVEEALCPGHQWIGEVRVGAEALTPELSYDDGQLLPAAQRLLAMRTMLGLAEVSLEVWKQRICHQDYKTSNFLMTVNRRAGEGSDGGQSIVPYWIDFERAARGDERYGDDHWYGTYAFAHPLELADIAEYEGAVAKREKEVEEKSSACGGDEKLEVVWECVTTAVSTALDQSCLAFPETANHLDAAERMRWRERFEVYRVGVTFFQLLWQTESYSGSFWTYFDRVFTTTTFDSAGYGEWMGVHTRRIEWWMHRSWSDPREQGFCRLILQMIDSSEENTLTMEEVVAEMRKLLSEEVEEETPNDTPQDLNQVITYLIEAFRPFQCSGPQ
ncbi:MAG: hypothetical protein ACOYKZ_01765 [Chlamydiia bacterium]